MGLCVDCRHHRINPDAGNVLCAHPRLNPNNHPLFRGMAALQIRGRFRTAFQEDGVRHHLGPLCEHRADWFEPAA